MLCKVNSTQFFVTTDLELLQFEQESLKVNRAETPSRELFSNKVYNAPFKIDKKTKWHLLSRNNKTILFVCVAFALYRLRERKHSSSEMNIPVIAKWMTIASVKFSRSPLTSHRNRNFHY